MDLESTSANNHVTNRRLYAWVIAFTLAFEIITCVFRFGLQLESTKHTASTIGQITCGIRIHHSYIGGVMMLASCYFWARFPRAAWWMLAVGMGLFLSDMIHHFLVLWPIVGSPQFDLTYPVGLQSTGS